MGRLGVIGGSAFPEGSPPEGTRPRRVETERGEVVVHLDGALAFLHRHGPDDRPPHRVRHHAHALALDALGVAGTVGLCSVGALHDDLAPGTLVVPSDYLSLHPPPTSAGDRRLHVVPELDAGLRRRLLRAAREGGGPVRDGGVYAETRGPRFETRAEIRLLADYADVVGMTAASEATLLQERGIAYAVLGVVDNYAHGVGDGELTLEGFEESVEANRARARSVLRSLRDREGGNGGSDVAGGTTNSSDFREGAG